MTGDNKSEAIRAYFKSHPDAKPKAVVEALKVQGVEVQTGLVSYVKNQLKKAAPARTSRKKASKLVAAKAASSSDVDGLTIERLMAAKEWVVKLGGIEAAKRALDVLEGFSDVR